MAGDYEIDYYVPDNSKKKNALYQYVDNREIYIKRTRINYYEEEAEKKVYNVDYVELNKFNILETLKKRHLS